MRFQLLKDWYDLVINVMIWGWGMPASLWYFSGSVLALLNGVNLTEQTLPYFNDTLQGAVFLILHNFLSAALNKGFELFEIFNLQERQGMNNMTVGQYFNDNLSIILFYIVLGLPAFWFFMWLIEIGGSIFPILTLVFTIGVLVVQKYLDFWLNDGQELRDDLPGLPNLRKEIHDIASKKGFPAKHICQVDASNGTRHYNAYVIGFGKSKKIIIYDKLLKGHDMQEPSTPGQKIVKQQQKDHAEELKFEVDEIKAIFAHELGHWHNNDNFKYMLFTSLEYAFVFYIFSLVINNISILKSFGFSEKSNFASLVILMKFHKILIFLTGKLQNAFFRRLEFKADEYAIKEFSFLGEKIRHGLQHALIKAFKINSANLNPDWLYAACFQNHPSLYERIKAVPESKFKSTVENNSASPNDDFDKKNIKERLLRKDDDEESTYYSFQRNQIQSYSFSLLARNAAGNLNFIKERGQESDDLKNEKDQDEEEKLNQTIYDENPSFNQIQYSINASSLNPLVKPFATSSKNFSINVNFQSTIRRQDKLNQNEPITSTDLETQFNEESIKNRGTQQSIQTNKNVFQTATQNSEQSKFQVSKIADAIQKQNIQQHHLRDGKSVEKNIKNGSGKSDSRGQSNSSHNSQPSQESGIGKSPNRIIGATEISEPKVKSAILRKYLAAKMAQKDLNDNEKYKGIQDSNKVTNPNLQNHNKKSQM